MSLLEHLEELRSRIIKALVGAGVAYGGCIFFAEPMWLAVSDPAAKTLAALGFSPTLKQMSVTDTFTVLYVKLPLLAAIFVSSPWLLWQMWAFVAPGLYQKERRFGASIVVSTATLFLAGGLFAYFIAFRFGLEFMIDIGRDMNVEPALNMVDYFDMFVNVMLGIGVIFELPVIIFILSLLQIVNTRFLMQNSRYAILFIVFIAAFITPTPDASNLMMFAGPMVLLYFVGVFASYLLERQRDGGGFPWLSIVVILLSLAGVMGGIIWGLVARYGYRVSTSWPFLQ